MTPLQPLAPMQRIGWLPISGQLPCRKSVYASPPFQAVFTQGQSYPFSTQKVKVQLKERRARRDGVNEPVTYNGHELLVRVKDNHGNWHRCLPNPAGEHPLIHDMEFLVEHFEIPAVPDLATLHPEQFRKNKRKLKQLEKLTCASFH